MSFETRGSTGRVSICLCRYSGFIQSEKGENGLSVTKFPLRNTFMLLFSIVRVLLQLSFDMGQNDDIKRV